MKVLCINSPLFREINSLYDEDSLPPIGLGYIATHLRNNGIQVELVDAVAEKIPLADLIALINAAKPQFVAVNIFTTNYVLVKEMIESIDYDAHIVIGGLSTRELHKEIFNWQTPNQIDVVSGDGELIMLDIVNNQLTEQPSSSLPNRRYFKAEGCSAYFVKDISKPTVDRSFFTNEPVKHPLGFTEANIVTSRGCIYNCAFCAAARSLNAEYAVRERSEESVVDELKQIHHQFPEVNSIRVLDDLFLKTKYTVQKAINVFSKFDFQWRSMAHVMTFNNVDDSVMNQLKASGCHELFIGIESGSPKVLKSINKTSNIDTILTNLTKVLKAGINIKGYFIYGFPNESKSDMELTYKLASELKDISVKYGSNFRTSVFQYRPYHGTEIFYNLKEDGKIINVENVKPNEALSHLVGRIQFNFHNGNYSEVDLVTIHDYIYRTINLNGGEIFAELRQYTKPGKK